MENRFPPRTWATPRSLAYEPVATGGAKSSVYKPISFQTAASQQPLYSDRRSIPASPPLSPYPPSQKRPKYKRLFSGGWRSGVTYSAIAAATILLINISLTLWASKKYGQESGLGTIFEGKCKKTKTASLWLHLGINILATVLLSASNYTMQCLASPTREEIDKAHRMKRWLDIGVPSMRNLRRISRGKLVLWLLLGVSSVPLHLIYNSVVFSSLSSYSYYVYTVAEGSLAEFPETFLGDPIKVQELNKIECMQAYGKQFVLDRSHLAIVVSDYNKTSDAGWTLLGSHGFTDSGYNTGQQPFNWICDSVNIDSESCNINEAIARVDTWTIEGKRVQSCRSARKPEKCSLNYSLHIMIAVIICNLVKAVCMVLTVFKSEEDPLVTVGDAVASFLNVEDMTTVGMCIVTKKDIKKGAWKSTEVVQGGWYPRMWKPYRAFWFSAASASRWVLCNFLAITSIAISLGFMSNGMKTWTNAKVSYSIQSYWDMGFGAIDLRAMFITGTSGGNKGLVSRVLLANLPQTIFSFLYLLYNSIFTCMLLAEEWDKYSHKRRPLRVTSPTGEQRSTYFLHLPYRYSLPLIVGSGTMHWLISQSMFFVQISEDPVIGLNSGSSKIVIPAIGYSPIAIIFGLTMAAISLVAALANGFRRYGGGMPLAASCSAAISAACHPGPQASSAATLPVMWGMVKIDSDEHVGHCSFSGGEVSPPIPGRWYSGESSRGKNLSMGSGISRDSYGRS